ncbi:hypothetical protein I307_04563 [Cryptococcus deuterogattii 99/473]|uniref:Unplaced genomic scaffold supercont1.3, whole genome shotgun sequence n=1 Tax=Cryptococcus deuterogattii Ram5 TaxID=1296110 RepID=A0A0D0U379_9TREE|nr:hypothetical protein I313_01826 [Cryptococcus deuterogattii Ram5]KIS00236.1 hypothetical protein L804_01645 [Cryptococcus deuterogattii 2001/935-1]KIY56168.1 hypothetical protein I307_04563 [Cryptococcus deuterogattii 99/473]
MTTASQPLPDISESLERHNAAFTTLLSLIPAQYYIAVDPEVADNKWMKNKKRKTGEEIKENKKKIKQTKLDPSKNLTTAELLAQNNSGEKLLEESSDAIAGPSTTLTPLPPTASISELRAKLQQRLQTFRSRRGAGDGEETHDGASVSSRDALEEERRRKRGEMRDRRRNERKEERRKEREGKAEKKEKKAAQQGPDDVRAKTAKTQLIVPQLKNTNNDEDISFPAISLPSKQSDKSGTHLKRISNPSQALAHLEKHKAKLAAMPEDKRAEIEEKERWAKAEERAKGGKVADQEKVLKNAVKRKEKTKAKSSKEWAERKRELEKSNAISIKKRNDNIAKRAEDRRNKRQGGGKDKGKGKGSKKGRPGFEGKK